MRLDKFLTASAVCSRKGANDAVRKGRVLINGIAPKKADTNVDPTRDTVTFDGVPVVYREQHYIMLNKPAGIVSATNAPNEKTVLDLLPENLRKLPFFPCGRLDKSTTGFVLLTTDGPLGHRLLSPKHHAPKMYNFTLKFPMSEEERATLENGVFLPADSVAEAFTTAPCTVILNDDRMGGTITLTEGKYHQIKRMAEAVHNQITALCRISFAGIPLDDTLAPGAWRYLSCEEEALLKEAGK